MLNSSDVETIRMPDRWIVPLFLLVLVCCCRGSVLAGDGKNYGVDLSIGWSTDRQVHYLPIYFTAFQWITDDGWHEITTEFFTKAKYDEHHENTFKVGGVNYAILFKVAGDALLIGPTVGLNVYSVYIYDDGDDFYKDGVYFGGAKACLLMGRNTFRFKMQVRLLVGLAEEELDMMNTLTAGIMVFF